MNLNHNLYGISGSINSGKDLVGEMIQYIGDTKTPTYNGFQISVNLTPSYTIKKCADKLKDVVCLILNCTRPQLEDETFKNKELEEEWWYYMACDNNGENIMIPYNNENIEENAEHELIKLTPRKILQLLGTQAGRMVIHPNIWVTSLFNDYKSKGLLQSKWIITDIRFPENEGIAVTKRNGLLIGVKRHFALKQPKYAYLADIDNPYDIPPKLKDVNLDLWKSLTHESELSMGDHFWCDIIIENNGTIKELFDEVLKEVSF